MEVLPLGGTDVREVGAAAAKAQSSTPYAMVP